MSEIRNETNGKKPTTKRRRGSALIYGVAVMSTLCGLASLAADYGRVQLTKVELRRAADAAARAGAGGLATSTAQAVTNATQFAQQNYADGTPITLQASADIQVGLWSNNTFTVLGANSTITPNAVHVTLHRTQARGNAVPLLFAKVLGATFCDVNADSIAEYIPPINVDQTVLATANPFLAGATQGETASAINPSDRHIADVAPLNAPNVVNIPLDGNSPLTFDSISGTARHDPNLPDYEPDGQDGTNGTTADIGHNNLTTSTGGNYSSTYYNENGIADMTCPIDALVGVFLDDSDPRVSSAPTPANLDFSTQTSRDFTTLKPQLKQLFFIGDGLASNGTVQNFVPPKGATRLYLATWDFYEWNNNSGQRTVLVSRPSKIITVK